MKNIDKYAPINFPLTISILGSFLFDYNEFRIRGTQFFPLGSILLNSYGQIFFCFYRAHLQECSMLSDSLAKNSLKHEHGVVINL